MVISQGDVCFVAIGRELLTERVGRLPESYLGRVIARIDLVLGRE